MEYISVIRSDQLGGVQNRVIKYVVSHLVIFMFTKGLLISLKTNQNAVQNIGIKNPPSITSDLNTDLQPSKIDALDAARSWFRSRV